MKHWDKRPIEIRNLFNPAFCGLVLVRSMSGYEEEDSRGIPFSLILLVLPLCLHRSSREILQDGSRSYLLKVISNNPELLIGFPRRATDMLPFAFEALGFIMQLGSISVENDGRLKLIPAGIRKTPSGTPETISCQRVARYLGREFARIGDRSTVYMSLGVRP